MHRCLIAHLNSLIDPDVVDLHGQVISLAIPSWFPLISTVVKLVHCASVAITVIPRLLSIWISVTVNATVWNEATRSTSCDVQYEVKL